MRSALRNIALGVALAGGVVLSAASAEDGIKALPTLLIKGEVVSLDTSDPAVALLKVKDRYGFETPIFLTQDTKVTQGETVLSSSNLAAGTPVEVEYNFDVNTAKRHAVSVKVAAPASTEAPPAAPAVTPPESAAAEPTAEPQAAEPAEPATPSEAAPSQPEAAPATQ